ncbi:neuromedin-U receptor 2 [Sardina pilchardus]|uniref:neuromedin-U receptor 2 n=1 Tax=Sardina pilchardus TaxID=27697 RepID=UPI002E14C606
MDFLLNMSGLNSSLCSNTSENNSTLDSPRYLEEIMFHFLGPRRSPCFLPVALTYLLIFIVGVGGNLLTCTVIAKHRKMRTPTNMYLFSLAVSDLLVLVIGMPLETYELWQNYPFAFGEGGCLFRVFLFETVCFASVLNVTALSVERYVAVVHPLRTRYAVTTRHVLRVIAVVWLAALLCALPNTLLHGIAYVEWRGTPIPQSATCQMVKPLWIYNLVIQVTTISFYFIPMTVISVLYMVIGVRLGQEQRSRGSGGGGESGKSGDSDVTWTIHVEGGRRRQVTKMLSVVVVVFAICWAPFHIDRLLWSFTTHWTDYMHGLYEYVHILSGVLFYLSSAVNPIIYNMLSSRFRERFRELVCHQGRSASSAASHNSPPFSKVLKSASCSTHVSSSGRRCRARDTASTSGWEHEDETTFM